MQDNIPYASDGYPSRFSFTATMLERSAKRQEMHASVERECLDKTLAKSYVVVVVYIPSVWRTSAREIIPGGVVCVSRVSRSILKNGSCTAVLRTLCKHMGGRHCIGIGMCAYVGCNAWSKKCVYVKRGMERGGREAALPARDKTHTRVPGIGLSARGRISRRWVRRTGLSARGFVPYGALSSRKRAAVSSALKVFRMGGRLRLPIPSKEYSENIISIEPSKNVMFDISTLTIAEKNDEAKKDRIPVPTLRSSRYSQQKIV